jgi:hypothetical protein
VQFSSSTAFHIVSLFMTRSSWHRAFSGYRHSPTTVNSVVTSRRSRNSTANAVVVVTSETKAHYVEKTSRVGGLRRSPRSSAERRETRRGRRKGGGAGKRETGRSHLVSSREKNDKQKSKRGALCAWSPVLEVIVPRAAPTRRMAAWVSSRNEKSRRRGFGAGLRTRRSLRMGPGRRTLAGDSWGGRVGT